MVRAVLVSLVAIAPASAMAKLNGTSTQGCNGCHGGGQTPNVTVTASNLNPALGSSITVTVTISAVNGGPGGLYLKGSGPGSFTLISGQSTKLVAEDDLVHSSPKAQSNGQITFQTTWNVPNTKGGVDFDAYVLAANGNGASSGDGAGYGRLSLAYGCAGTTYYRDFDADGVGSAMSGTTVNCAPPSGYSAQDGDCNDNDERMYPGATEICNNIDDDCDGQVNENLPAMTYYPDADGDGYGVPGPTKMGCGDIPNYAPSQDDCADDDAKIHPGAAEVCNFDDDDCDGKIDDGARVVCGVGMCARYGLTCDPALCTPGRPEKEVCNYLDDDCDGAIDNGDTCGAGQTCHEGKCIASTEVPDAGSNTGGADAGTKPRPEEPVGCIAAPSVTASLLLASVALSLFAARRGRRSPSARGD